jgi:hypothetical protein
MEKLGFWLIGSNISPDTDLKASRSPHERPQKIYADLYPDSDQICTVLSHNPKQFSILPTNINMYLFLFLFLKRRRTGSEKSLFIHVDLKMRPKFFFLLSVLQAWYQYFWPKLLLWHSQLPPSKPVSHGGPTHHLEISCTCSQGIDTPHIF